MKTRDLVDGSTVGKFERGGRSKFVPAWITRTRQPKVEPEAKKVITTKTYKITINLWKILQWSLIVWMLYIIWSNTTITFTFQ
jgi:hypothetical protein